MFPNYFLFLEFPLNVSIFPGSVGILLNFLIGNQKIRENNQNKCILQVQAVLLTKKNNKNSFLKTFTKPNDPL